MTDPTWQDPNPDITAAWHAYRGPMVSQEAFREVWKQSRDAERQRVREWADRERNHGDDRQTVTGREYDYNLPHDWKMPHKVNLAGELLECPPNCPARAY